jgi:FkbM family methyltransferase
MKQRFLTLRRKWLYRLRNKGRSNCHIHRYFGVDIHHQAGDDVIQRTLNEGIFESDVVKTIRQFLRPETAYFDIGANLGLLSVPFLDVPDLHIHSIEPGPATFQFLSNSAQTAERPRWHLHGIALGKESGTADFHTGGKFDAALAGLRSTGRAKGDQIHKVKVTTLDELWTSVGKPSISMIKIDVEGGEIDVLAAGYACLQTCRPAITMEIDPTNFPTYGQTVANIFDFIEGLGYEIYHLPDYRSHKPRFARISNSTELAANLSGDINYLLLPAVRV